MIYVITGLSGSGKTTIAKEVSKKTNLPLVTTATTRPMRPGEKNSIDYWFLSVIPRMIEYLRDNHQGFPV